MYACMYIYKLLIAFDSDEERAVVLTGLPVRSETTLQKGTVSQTKLQIWT